MNRLSTILYSFAGIGLVCAASPASAIDFTKVNASIASSLETFSAESELIETFTYAFTPETNVDEDKYVLDMALAVTKTPWAEARTSMEGVISFQANLSDQADRGVAFGIDLKASTDALAMLKFKLKKMSHCDAESFGSGIMKVLWARHCEYVGQLDAVANVAALRDLLAQKISDHRADVTAYITLLNQTLQTSALDERVLELIKGDLKKANAALTFIDGITLQEQGDGFVIKSAAFEGCPIVGISGIEMKVQPEMVHIKGAIKLKFGKVLYAASRDVVLDVLNGLEQGEAYAAKLVQYDAMMLESLINRAITGSAPVQ